MKKIVNPDDDPCCYIGSPAYVIPWSERIRFTAWLLIAAMINLNACMSYFRVRSLPPPATQKMAEFEDQRKTFILHFANEDWYLDFPDITPDALTGIAERKYVSTYRGPVKPHGPNRYHISKGNNETYLLNEVHIYITEMTRFDDSKVAIPLSGIRKVEVYELDKGATIGSWTLGLVGFTAATASVILLIALLTKQSCPFIYSYSNNDYHFTGEIYSGCIQPPLERNDYLKLPVNDPENDQYYLRIVNEVREIQHTNLMELWVYDHPRNMEVMVDKYGHGHTVCEQVAPQRATDLAGNDILKLISRRDSLFYASTFSPDEQPVTDGIVLEFPNPAASREADLTIRAKNSFVLDYMIGRFHDQFGDVYHKFAKRQQKAPAGQLIRWSLDQNIPLSLSVERNGAWQKVDYFNIAGPMAMKDDVLQIPLDGREGDPLRVKLEFGNYFWEIDYAALDCAKDSLIDCRVIPLTSATDQKGRDVTHLLRKDDNRYYVQPSVGDQAAVTFLLPPTAGESRTIYLHSKGWYQILRDPHGKPDLEYLRTFRQPGQFNRFVNEEIKRMIITDF